MEQAYLRRGDAAKYLKGRYGAGTAGTLAKLATIGGGPKFTKLGRFPIYAPDDLDAWARGRMSAKVGSTSELTAAGVHGEAT